MTLSTRYTTSEWPTWLKAAWCKDPKEEGSMWASDTEGLWLRNLEGVSFVRWNDWIIQGIKGELYPCKPGIFEATYDRIRY